MSADSTIPAGNIHSLASRPRHPGCGESVLHLDVLHYALRPSDAVRNDHLQGYRASTDLPMPAWTHANHRRPEELSAVRMTSRLMLVLTTLLALLALSTPAQAADAYPYRSDTTRGADPWGFTKRECVSYVAWRLAQRGAPIGNAAQQWGNAASWDDASRRLGVGIGARPVVGAVAHWNAYESNAYYSPGSTRPNGTMRAGGYGHVGYVQGVHSDGSAVVAHYNMYGDRAYSLVRVKAPRYLYLAVGGPR